MISLQQIHHVAYRCTDAKETVEFYQKYLNMDLLVCISEAQVPSTKEENPYMHVFLDAGQGNILAFFELTGQKPLGRDENTPKWVQHIAFKLESVEKLIAAKKELESKGVDVLGITDHGIFKSIYFFDPNGHRLELTALTSTDEQLQKLRDMAPEMLEESRETKSAPKGEAWLHEMEFKDS